MPRLLPILAFALCSALPAADWPQNLGPSRDGLLPATPLRTGWHGAKAPLAWRAPSGLGSAPPIAVGGKVYTFGAFRPATTAEQLDDPEAVPTLPELKKQSTVTGQQLAERFGDGVRNFIVLWNVPGMAEKEKLAQMAEPHFYIAALWAQCFDAATGKRLWAARLSDYSPICDAQPYWPQASPLFVDGKVFFHGPSGDLFLVDAASGKTVWERSLVKDGVMGEFGKQSNAGGGMRWKDTIIISLSHPPVYHHKLMAVRIADGTTAWTSAFEAQTFRAQFGRFGFAEIAGKPTVLLSLGEGTAGVDPDDGAVRWQSGVPIASKALYEQRYAELASRWAGDEAVTKAMRNKVDSLDAWKKSLYAPYQAYAPVTWNGHVIDALMSGHDDFVSQMWCERIVDGKPTLAWQTLDTVPECHSDKSNMLAKDGRLYVFDQNSYAPRGLLPAGDGGRLPEARPFRAKGIGQFQCFDIASGKRLWHSDAFRTHTATDHDDTDHYKMILVGDQLIVTGNDGLWIARLGDSGVEILASASLGNAHQLWLDNVLAEPVLADQRLFIRQSEGRAKNGLNAMFPGTGNLYCFDLRPAAGK